MGLRIDRVMVVDDYLLGRILDPERVDGSTPRTDAAALEAWVRRLADRGAAAAVRAVDGRLDPFVTAAGSGGARVGALPATARAPGEAGGSAGATASERPIPASTRRPGVIERFLPAPSGPGPAILTGRRGAGPGASGAGSPATALATARAADDKLGHDTVILDGADPRLADYFVTPPSTTARRSIVEELLKRLSRSVGGASGRGLASPVSLDHATGACTDRRRGARLQLARRLWPTPRGEWTRRPAPDAGRPAR